MRFYSPTFVLVPLLATLLVACTPAARPTADTRPATDQPTVLPATGSTVTPASQVGDGTLVRLTVLSEGSEARYRAREQLAQFPLPGEAVGASPAVRGEVLITLDGSILPDQSRVEVDLRQLRSNERLRDRWIQDNTIQTARFPTAEFVPREARGLPIPVPIVGDIAFELLGDLTVRGVTRPVTWSGTATANGSEASAQASTQVRLSDFGMAIPRLPLVLSVEDTLTLELDLRLRQTVE